MPVVNISGTFDGPSPITVHYDASGSYDLDGDRLEFNWYFSDGVMETGPAVSREYIESGRHEAILEVKDAWGTTARSEPAYAYVWGLANAPWPKFAHDERNSGVSQNRGPMMDLANADSGGAFPRYWRSGTQDGEISGIVVGYDGVVFYTQADRLHARTYDGGHLWNYVFDSEITSWPAILHDGSVVLTTKTVVYRINTDGELLWLNDFGAECSFGPVVSITETGILIPWRELSAAYDYDGWLQALNFDSTEQWMFPIKDVRTGNRINGTSIYPAILPNDNIVINGFDPIILTPAGAVFSTFELDTIPTYMGAPSINPDGLITFTNHKQPVFDSNGNLLYQVFDQAGNTSPGVPGVWDQNYLTTCSSTLEYTDGFSFHDYHLHTIGQDGNYASLTMTSIDGSHDRTWYKNGACSDVDGRIYASTWGIRAMSPASMSGSPPAPHRYSLWSYERDTWAMTPPVIGEDGWLYVGYGTDIMAIGD